MAKCESFNVTAEAQAAIEEAIAAAAQAHGVDYTGCKLIGSQTSSAIEVQLERHGATVLSCHVSAEDALTGAIAAKIDVAVRSAKR